jgi:alpha-beta hydrolase superfamily lysophospholipase
VREEVTRFGGAGCLIGITTTPCRETGHAGLPAVIILNAGIIHRVGPNRVYVKLARDLASLGFTVLRFDFSGTGDSQAHGGEPASIVERMIHEARQAMDHLQQSRSIDRFILMGLCSGATISFKTACRDERVVGAVLINPNGHLHGDDEKLGARLREQAMARHYWRMATSRSFRMKNWRKVLTGGVDYGGVFRALAGFWKRGPGESTEAPLDTHQTLAGHADMRRLTERNVGLAVIHAEADEGLDYLYLTAGETAANWQGSKLEQIRIIEGANHVFTMHWSQQELVDLVHGWLEDMLPVLTKVARSTPDRGSIDS